MKDVSEGKINKEFVGLKTKMYSLKNIDGKGYNTVKRANIATEFNELKDTLFNKKEFKVKNIKLEHTKSTKYHYHVLMIEDLF